MSVDQQFDPAAWLDRFVEIGGRYANTSNGVWLSGPVDGDLIAFEHEVLRDPDKRELVKAHIISTTVMEAAYG